VNVDGWVDQQVRRWRGNRPLDRLMYTASRWGDDGRVWIAASAWRAGRSSDPRRYLVRQMSWLTVESVIVNGPMKGVVSRPRPAPEHDHPHRMRHPSDSSFPSGHAASAAMMAMLLSEDGSAPMWWALALTIATSRVYVGVHHASDVAAGLAIGTAFGYAARRLDRPRPGDQRGIS